MFIDLITVNNFDSLTLQIKFPDYDNKSCNYIAELLQLRVGVTVPEMVCMVVLNCVSIKLTFAVYNQRGEQFSFLHIGFCQVSHHVKSIQPRRRHLGPVHDERLLCGRGAGHVPIYPSNNCNKKP